MTDDFMSEAPLPARKEAIYPLSVINRPIPGVGIFDEPTRCYKINKQWARIVMGFASLLTQPEVWSDAENDLYGPIQEILKFLEGSECGMNCEELQDCLETSQIIINIQNELNDLRDYVENGASTTVLDTTLITDVFPYVEQLDNIGDLDYVGCNEDEVWGAVVSLVDYIHQTNLDFLQRVSSATNLAAQVERAIAATPVIGWFPADEAVGLVDWYANEALAAYLAVVDEELLLETKCDLFCLAMSSDPCGLNFADLINYFSARVPLSASQFSDTLANLILFAITGTFTGNDYFYYMSYFQLAVAAIGEKFMNTRGKETYAIYAAAGKNSPDNDWTLFCDPCSTAFYIEYDFTKSDGGFTSATGTWQAGIGWVANVTGDGDPWTASMTISKEFATHLPISWAGGFIYSANRNCGINGHSWVMLKDAANVGSGSIGNITNGDNIPIVWTRSSNSPYQPVEFDTVQFGGTARACFGLEGRFIIHKARIWLDESSPIRGIPTDTYPQGLGPNGSSSLTFWQP